MQDETKTKLVDDSEVDRQAQKFERINDSVYSLYEPADPNAELVFFHGIAQESHEACKDMHLKAWMSSSGEIWPAEWLHKEAKFRRARILSVDYTYSQGLLFFNEMENLALDLINADVGQRDRPVVLVGHDVGGLVIKEICVYLEAKAKHCGAENVRSFWSRKCEDFLKHLRGVFYFSVPHLGLQIADSTDLNGEEFMRVQNRNARINEQFSKIRSKRRWTTAGLAHLLEDRDGSIRIPEGSLRFDMDIFMMERKSREEINKPDSPYSSGFQYFVSCVTGFLQGEVDEDGNEKFGSGDEDLAEVGSRVDEVGRKVDGLPSLSSSVKKARQILKETETKLDFELDRQGGHLEEETKTDSELSLVCDSVLDHQSQKFEETSESSAAVQERIVELTSTSASRSAQRLRPYTDYGVEKLTDNLYDLSSTTCEKGKENAVVIFFHGLELDDSANPDETWLRTWTFRDNPAVCWPPQMFSTDKLLQENNVVVRAYASKYDANKYRTRNSGRLNLYLFAENVLETVIPRVMRSTEIQIPIFLVAHGFGGFVIQELIEHAFKKTRRVSSDPFAKRFLQCLGGILFYAVPFNSLKQDTYDTIFGHGQQTLAEPGEMLSQFNKELIRSREIFKRNINSIVGDPSNGLRSGAEIRIKAAFEIHETDMEHWKGVIVVEGGVHPAAEIVIIEADHLSICRPLSGPDGYTEAQYTCLQELIVDVVKAERLRYANQGNNLLKAFQPSSPTEIVTKEKTDETCHPYSSPAKVTLEEVDLVKLKTFQPSSPREKIVMEEKTDETFQPSSSPEIGTVKEADIDTLETNQPSSLTEKNTKEKTNETFQPSTPASEIVEENNDRVTEDNNYPTERLELHFHMHQQVVIIVNPRLPKFTGIPVW
ncbi:hypothetical protein R1sor_015525 [Riccia sorocarpa]|uniref:Protein SERAC1 n=1 Tax=Riccia sorocarpa TaxID=122646 RepID=A0ABD3HGN5_9MARC